MSAKIRVTSPVPEEHEHILSTDALEFVRDLSEHFEEARRDLLEERVRHQFDLDHGDDPDFIEESADIRRADWQVAPTPDDLQDRRVEITGPVDRKMMINALCSGAKVFMADFEDALSPTWANVVAGQANLVDAVRRTIEYRSPEGKEYRLGDRIATLMVRPRGWHLVEKHVLVGEEPISASLFDFGLYFFHNAHELLRRKTGPYFYLPKLEHHSEARLWNQVFRHAQEKLHVPQGSIRATVLVENILAAFQMEEILYELREHSAGLNAGRWDYIFSIIRKFRARDLVLPDRSQVTMTVPFMRAYTELLVRTCHKRGAHAIGGMAAFIPNRRDPEVTERALTKVTEDKQLEAGSGFDGTWVAHPDLVPTAQAVFDEHLGHRPHQKDRLREDVHVEAKDLLDFRVPDGQVTEAGVRLNINVGLQYLGSWLGGWGAAAISNLMEDTATAEISRAQLWQWHNRGVKLEDGRVFDAALYKKLRDEELEKLGGRGEGHYGAATEIMDELVLEDRFTSFLTLLAYDRLD